MEPPIVVGLIAAAAAVIAASVAAWFTWLASGTSQLRARVESLEAQAERLWAARRQDALLIRAQGDHIDVLEHHIWEQLPPPPPARPTGV